MINGVNRPIWSWRNWSLSLFASLNYRCRVTPCCSSNKSSNKYPSVQSTTLICSWKFKRLTGSTTSVACWTVFKLITKTPIKFWTYNTGRLTLISTLFYKQLCQSWKVTPSYREYCGRSIRHAPLQSSSGSAKTLKDLYLENLCKCRKEQGLTTTCCSKTRIIGTNSTEFMIKQRGAELTFKAKLLISSHGPNSMIDICKWLKMGSCGCRDTKRLKQSKEMFFNHRWTSVICIQRLRGVFK